MELPIPLWWLEFDQQLRENKAVEKVQGEAPGLGGFSKREWDEARKRHREKLKHGNGNRA